MKPWTVVPALWESSRRRVTFCSFVYSLSGTFHETSWSLMFPSSDHPRFSAWCSTARVVTGLLMEAAWKRVSGVTGSVPPDCFTPWPLAQTSDPLSNTAMLSPGILYSAIHSWRERRRVCSPGRATGESPASTRAMRAASEGRASHWVVGFRVSAAGRRGRAGGGRRVGGADGRGTRLNSSNVETPYAVFGL